jgi:hypothetical protein
VTLVHWDDVEGFDIPADLQPLGGQSQDAATCTVSAGDTIVHEAGVGRTR